MLQQLTDKNRLTKAHTQAFRSSLALNRNAAGFSKEFKEGIYTLVCDKAVGPYVHMRTTSFLSLVKPLL